MFFISPRDWGGKVFLNAHNYVDLTPLNVIIQSNQQPGLNFIELLKHTK